MPSNSYDLIVLGDDLPGLIAATLVVRRGQRVLLLLSGRPDSYKLGPHTLPTRTVSMAGRSGASMRRIFDELHLGNPISRRLGRTRPAFQLAMPKVRLDVFADDEAFLRGLEREAGDAEALLEAANRSASLSMELDATLADDIVIPPNGFFERREIARHGDQLDGANEWWKGLESSALGQALFGAPAALTTALGDEGLTPVTRLRAFDLWRHGAPRLSGDMRTLRELFLEKFDKHGGDVRIGRAAELTFGWGSKVSGVILEDGDELGAGHVLFAQPVSELEPMSGKQARKLHGADEEIELAGYRYMLNLVIDEVGVPEGMAHALFYVDDPDQPLTGANAMLVHVSEPDSGANISISATVNCPIAEGRTVEQSFADLRVRVRQKLESIMPFVTDHVLVAHSPHERLPAEGLEGEYELDEPVEPEPYWSRPSESYLGISGLPYQVGLKNLTLCNSQILPGLGLEGDFEVGWQAARMALGGSKKKDPLATSVFAGVDR
ncbi:MAG: hypothetical protein KJO07_11610 [Deltaproteobacteria bacterium]|nr:hypothetical protein [Deltaproteobacteria bacterium]